MQTDPQQRPPILYLTVGRPGDRSVEGLWYFWGMYVRGFDPRVHCKRCFIGTKCSRVGTRMRMGVELPLFEDDEAPYYYLCGGAGRGYQRQGKWEDNFHLAVRRVDGGLVEAETYNGIPIRLRNAERVEIPDLPDGWEGLSKRYTTCRNFRFGVHAFGMK